MGLVARRLVLATLGSLVGVLLLAPAAQAQFGISNFTAQVFADDARDTSTAFSETPGEEADPYSDLADPGTGVYDLAGGHPYIGVIDFSFNRVGPGDAGPPSGQNVARLRVDIPRGLQPNPESFAQCTDAQLEAHACPLESQIGVQRLRLFIPALAGVVPPTQGNLGLRIPLYNMTPLSHPVDAPQHDVVARFAFHPAEAAGAATAAGLGALAGGLANLHAVHLVGGVRDAPSQFGPHDNGLFFMIDHLPVRNEANPASPGVLRSNLTFWGVPGDPTHNDERGEGCVSELPTPPFPVSEICVPLPGVVGSPPDPDVPFLTNPTECTGQPLVSRLTVWSHPYVGAPEGTEDTEVDLTPTIDGQDGALHCENIPFTPGLGLLPDVTLPDTPSGPIARLLTPQPGLVDKDLFTTSHVKDVSVTLPEGLTINPSLANGLETCTDAQLAANVGVPGGETCPAASRIGDSKVVTPVLVPLPGDPSADLKGSAYVGQPLVGDKYRLFVTLEGREVSIRLKGSIKLNPSTGQVTATFPNNPQLPFSNLDVDFRGGSRAPLATPLDCGAKAARALFTAWSGHAPVNAQSPPFSIEGSCPAPFVPSLAASTANPAAGAYSALSVGISRKDRHQFLSGVRVEVPPGFAGFISRVTQCAQSQAATGACPASSRIGTVDTSAGAGPEPYRLSGQVYLTRKYKKGSAFGIVSVVRAIAGPYDLGTVIVRQSLFVDPDDGHITATGDQLPRILDGVPIRLRSARVTINRSRFAFNPTSCGPKTATARLHSTQDFGASIEAPPVRIIDCDRLAFKPRLAMRLTGRKQTTEGRHPGVKAVLKHRFGQSNIKQAKVTLPLSLALDPENARGLCSYERGLRAKCPAKTRIGHARVFSPVLNRSLKGRVFFVKGVRFGPTGNRIRTLPTLLVKLRGEVRINLRAQSSIDRRGRLISTFSNTPDLPVKRFRMVLKGGKGGILVVTTPRGICGRKQVARLRMDGHNGKVKKDRLRLKTPCARKRR